MKEERNNEELELAFCFFVGVVFVIAAFLSV